MSAHTPGPWTVDHYLPGQSGDGQLHICGDERRIPLAVLDPDDIEAEANARLIAAAPEMLEALRQITAYVVERDSCLDAKAVARVAVAALAKAEGQPTHDKRLERNSFMEVYKYNKEMGLHK